MKGHEIKSVTSGKGEIMPNINEINTAVYSLLAGDEILSGLCTIYKGKKRPSKAQNPSVTIDTKRLERGEGEGIWMCDVVVTVYTDLLANRMADHRTLTDAGIRIREVLSDRELTLENAKAHPLIEGESLSPDWEGNHENESRQEKTFGLVFIQFY